MDIKSQLFKLYDNFKVIGNSQYELHLRTHKSISDNEWSEISKILFYNNNGLVGDYEKQLVRIICEPFINSMDDDWNKKAEFEDIGILNQYLIGIGILVPVVIINNGCETTYVNDIIEFDYVKIKS